VVRKWSERTDDDELSIIQRFSGVKQKRTPAFLIPGGLNYTQLGRLAGYETDTMRGYYDVEYGGDTGGYRRKYMNCAPPEQNRNNV
jgi:hypothetical protein